MQNLSAQPFSRIAVSGDCLYGGENLYRIPVPLFWFPAENKNRLFSKSVSIAGGLLVPTLW